MKDRFNQPVKQWIKFSVWSLIYVLFIVWVGNYWWLLLLPFIFDMFITHFIPYDWWKKYKDSNPIVYTICSWIDAIVFALVAVYFIFLYLLDVALYITDKSPPLNSFSDQSFILTSFIL